MRMTGQNPIEYYYPNGFGELNIVSTGATSTCIDWTVGKVVNYKYDGGDAERPIVEKSLVGTPTEGCESQTLRVKAVHRDVLDKTAAVYKIAPACARAGEVKYAYLYGNMPETLSFDIDTGDFRGCIPEIDELIDPQLLVGREYSLSGFPVPVGVSFVARAFDSGNPTGNYIDGEFTFNLYKNWDLERKKIALNTNDSELNTEFDSNDCICEE